MSKEKRYRNRFIILRMSDEEIALLKRLAGNEGQEMCAFIRSRVGLEIPRKGRRVVREKEDTDLRESV